MNKLGIHAYVWEPGWNREQSTRAINNTAEAGFDYVEISAMDPSAIDADFTRRELERAGIGCNFSLGLDATADISSGDREKAARGKETLETVVRVARDCGAQYVCGILYSAFQKYSHPTTPEGIAMAVDVLGQVAQTAAKSGITLGLEVVNRYESNVLNTASQAVDFCKRIGMPNVKVHLDTYHMNIEESNVFTAIRDTGDYLGYFHIGESNRGYLGTGSVDFTSVFRALALLDYKGPIAFESFSSRVIGQPLEGILGIWRNLWEDGYDLASHALEYTNVNMKAAQEVLKEAERSQLPKEPAIC